MVHVSELGAVRRLAQTSMVFAEADGTQKGKVLKAQPAFCKRGELLQAVTAKSTKVCPAPQAHEPPSIKRAEEANGSRRKRTETDRSGQKQSEANGSGGSGRKWADAGGSGRKRATAGGSGRK